ncbi:MAG: FtsQ-type POTRA domain-containing protein [Acidobacteria bacterium]|nr:FtsQ-type POTRA domain-containing protein [Acidobacteriota bacterium]
MPREAHQRSRLRLLLRAGGWFSAVAVAWVVVARVYGFAATDERFTLRAPRWPGDRAAGLIIEGSVYSNRERIARVFASDFGRSVLLMPLAERRRRLLAIDWVEDAVVSRLWPSQALVRITERRPVAFVDLVLRGAGRRAASHIALIDAHGVLLDPPPKSRFTFPVLNGVTAEQSEAERRDRVGRMLRLLEEVGQLGSSISEVDVSNPANLSLIVKFEGRALELELGSERYGSRLANFLEHYPEIRQRSPAGISFDLRLDDRITAKE